MIRQCKFVNAHRMKYSTHQYFLAFSNTEPTQGVASLYNLLFYVIVSTKEARETWQQRARVAKRLLWQK